MILRNHGLLTCGQSIADAFTFMFLLQRSCEIQLQAQATGQEMIKIPDPILAGIQKQAAENNFLVFRRVPYIFHSLLFECVP